MGTTRNNKGKNNPMYGKHHTKETIMNYKKKRKATQIGSNNYNWQGGKVVVDGYVSIYQPNHPFTNAHRRVCEHRLIVEKQIGRYLLPEEATHHINGIKDDNRPKNLMAFVNNSAHTRFHKNPKNVKDKEIIFDGHNILL